VTASEAPSSLLLLLLDSRSPAGGHQHSAGMEAAVAAGFITGLSDVENFCRGRLRTSGRVAAGAAARACRLALADAPAVEWLALDLEVTARTPSEATRTASRQLGRGFGRLLRSAFADQGEVLAAMSRWWQLIERHEPHHGVVLGAGVGLAGGNPQLAARAAALAGCVAPASAGVRLLGLDPYGVHAMLSRLGPEIDRVAELAADELELAASSAPALELLADVHVLSEVRLFAS
jgi:urease accessory protein